MTGFLLYRPTEIWWSTRRSQGLLVAAILPFLANGPLITAVGLEEPPRSAWIVVPLAIAIGALQLRHSFAAARGVLPWGWPMTLLALGFLVYVPLIWFQWDWASMQWFFIASAAMLLRGRVMKVLIIAPLLGTLLACVISGWNEAISPASLYFYVLVYWGVNLVAGAACLYGTSQLVRAVGSLFATRADMAAVTVGTERLRVSRDLHDLLGQSLSAVSLKGDLAIALLHSDPPAAEAEIRSLTEVARDALRDIRHVVHGEHPVTLRNETEGAAALLGAASIDAHIDVELQDLLPEVDELFGWATREGVTNMLRHSQAATCSIRATRHDGAALLEIVNDGAGPMNGSGSGIAGLTERAESLSGRVDAGLLRDGHYRLSVTVPEVFV
jgi:two-component system, NarL family, sensor histidine kinase DesK